MKTVVIIYYTDDWHKENPFNSKYTQKSFEDWYEMAQPYGIKFYRASIKWFDVQKMSFSKIWSYNNKKWIKMEKDIKPDVIFDKTFSKRSCELLKLKLSFPAEVKFINDPLFRASLDSKLSQFLMFSEFIPQSFLVNNKKELAILKQKINSTKIVTKPIHGIGGSGIRILNQKDILNENLTYPLIIQEFIENNKGIPGLNQNCNADLRLVYTDHQLIYALSRIAKKGSLLTNFHQGAHGVLVPLESIPEEVKNQAQKIVQKLKIFANTHYSLDFIFNDLGKAYFMEINTTPGFDLIHNIIKDKEVIEKNFQAMVNLIKN